MSDERQIAGLRARESAVSRPKVEIVFTHERIEGDCEEAEREIARLRAALAAAEARAAAAEQRADYAEHQCDEGHLLYKDLQEKSSQWLSGAQVERDQLRAERDAERARAEAAEQALRGVVLRFGSRDGRCWCPHFRSPDAAGHTAACTQARAILQAADQRGGLWDCQDCGERIIGDGPAVWVDEAAREAAYKAARGFHECKTAQQIAADQRGGEVGE